MNDERIMQGVKTTLETLRSWDYKPEEKIVILAVAGKLVNDKMDMELRLQGMGALIQKMMGG